MQYRPDIAGLRAVAVLPILLFHAGVTAMGGGFVGVDIFFVISGFLITSIILRDLEAGRFTMAEFYRRRVARIVPALLVMLVLTLVAGWVTMLPPEYRALGKSAAMASVFLSNIHFFVTADYFGATAEATPLLHTWSLAVEEQFYIFYPLMMLALWRWGRRGIPGVVLVCCLLSFAVALYLGQTMRGAAAFYLIPARGWELGIGALVALGLFPRLGPRLARGAALAGLIAIGLAIFLIRPGAGFPAPWGLMPCLGAAALIAYGREGLTARLLSLRPMRFFGDISYSLYLWHWPVITFYRLRTGIHLTPPETVLLIALSILLGWASWRWVERPALARLRHGPRLSAPRVALGGFAVLLATASIAIALPRLAAKLRSYPSHIATLAAFIDYRDTAAYDTQFRKGICLMGEGDAHSFNRDCLKVDPSRRNLVVMGDSHAAQFWLAFTTRYSDRNVIQATAAGCRPLIGATGEARCTDLMEHVFAEVLRAPGVDTVVLSGRWLARETKALVATARALRDQGLQVMVIGPTVEYDGDYPLLMARAMLANDAQVVDTRRLGERESLDLTLAPLIRETGAIYVSAYRLECPEGGPCRQLSSKGSPFHFDYGHLTADAAWDLVEEMPPL